MKNVNDCFDHKENAPLSRRRLVHYRHVRPISPTVRSDRLRRRTQIPFSRAGSIQSY